MFLRPELINIGDNNIGQPYILSNEKTQTEQDAWINISEAQLECEFITERTADMKTFKLFIFSSRLMK